MGSILVAIIAIILFTLAGTVYWKFLKILTLLIQFLAYAVGILVTLSIRDDNGLILGLLGGTAVYLIIFSMVIIIRRVGSLETEVRKLGGNPSKISFLDYGMQLFRGAQASITVEEPPLKPKNDEVNN